MVRALAQLHDCVEHQSSHYDFRHVQSLGLITNTINHYYYTSVVLFRLPNHKLKYLQVTCDCGYSIYDPWKHPQGQQGLEGTHAGLRQLKQNLCKEAHRAEAEGGDAEDEEVAHDN